MMGMKSNICQLPFQEISDDDAISSVGHIKGNERDGMLTALKLSSIKSQGPIKQNFFAASPGWPCLSKKVTEHPKESRMGQNNVATGFKKLPIKR